MFVVSVFFCVLISAMVRAANIFNQKNNNNNTNIHFKTVLDIDWFEPYWSQFMLFFLVSCTSEVCVFFFFVYVSLASTINCNRQEKILALSNFNYRENAFTITVNLENLAFRIALKSWWLCREMPVCIMRSKCLNR